MASPRASEAATAMGANQADAGGETTYQAPHWRSVRRTFPSFHHHSSFSPSGLAEVRAGCLRAGDVQDGSALAASGRQAPRLALPAAPPPPRPIPPPAGGHVESKLEWSQGKFRKEPGGNLLETNRHRKRYQTENQQDTETKGNRMASASAGLPPRPRPASLPPALHPLPRTALRRPAVALNPCGVLRGRPTREAGAALGPSRRAPATPPYLSTSRGPRQEQARMEPGRVQKGTGRKPIGNQSQSETIPNGNQQDTESKL